jgi:hypothetical protein
MSVRLYIRIATTLAVVAVAAGGVSSASADSSKGIQIPPNLANFQEPGSTGYVPMTPITPAWLKNFREPGSTGYVPETTHVVIPANLANFQEPGSTGFVPAEVTVASPADTGLDWVSAVIGAGAGLGLAIAGAGAFVAVRKRRTLAHA